MDIFGISLLLYFFFVFPLVSIVDLFYLIKIVDKTELSNDRHYCVHKHFIVSVNLKRLDFFSPKPFIHGGFSFTLFFWLRKKEKKQNQFTFRSNFYCIIVLLQRDVLIFVVYCFAYEIDSIQKQKKNVEAAIAAPMQQHRGRDLEKFPVFNL